MTINQHQFVPTTPEICSNVDGAFDHFIFSGYPEADSVQWFQVYQHDTTYLGTSNPIDVPVTPLNRKFFCYQFYANGDMVVSETQLYSCFYSIYFPNSFGTDENGINDCFKIYHNFEYNPSSSVYWRVMSLDGVVLFETGNLDACWDGEFQGSTVPSGSYLLFIRIEFENEGIYEYDGLLTIVQ